MRYGQIETAGKCAVTVICANASTGDNDNMSDEQQQRSEGGLYAPGNAGAVSHGSYGLLRKLRDGTLFQGLALDLEQAARDELETSGALEAMKVIYARHMGCAAYFWGVMSGTTDADRYQRLAVEFRKLNERCFLMAQVLRAVEQAGDGLVIDAIEAAQKAAEEAQE